MRKQSILKTKKRGYIDYWALAFIGAIAVAVTCIITPPVLNKMAIIDATIEWEDFTSDLNITIEEKEDYIGTIRLEKEHGTLELDDLAELIETIGEVHYSGLSLVEDSSTKGLAIKYADT